MRILKIKSFAKDEKSQGLSDSALVMVYEASADSIFCLHVFAKNETENISRKQLRQLKLLAMTLLSLQSSELKKAIATGEFTEVSI